jgi:BirA family transcriptional regulator, biotin operon repressor / biotin---[acetyl-CoA-carboxylase] ligase
MPLDECVESPSVAVSRFADEVHVTELPVRENPPGRGFLLGLTGGHGGWLHGTVSLVRPMADALTPAAVEPVLRGRFGRPFLYRDVCESTQRLLDRNLGEGAVAVCDEQTGGRGRLGRRWSAPPGTAILASVLLEPPPGRALAELSLVAGVATAEAVESVTRRPAQIKWPNDVLVDAHKVAGVLAEASEGSVVLGIGLNVDQETDQLPSGAALPAGSLRTVTASRHDRAPILADLLLRLEQAYDVWKEGGLGAIHPRLETRDFLRGRRLLVDGEAGLGIGIERGGRLAVDVAGERRLVESGEVLLAD